MIKKTISIARASYEAPVCEELNVRIEQSILSAGDAGNDGYGDNPLPDLGD